MLVSLLLFGATAAAAGDVQVNGLKMKSSEVRAVIDAAKANGGYKDAFSTQAPGGKTLKEHLEGLKSAQDFEDALVDAEIYDKPIVAEVAINHNKTEAELVRRVNNLRAKLMADFQKTAEAFNSVVEDFEKGANKGDLHTALASSADPIVQKIAKAHPKPIAPSTVKKDALELLLNNRAASDAVEAIKGNSANDKLAIESMLAAVRKNGKNAPLSDDSLKKAAAMKLATEGEGDGEIANVPPAFNLDAMVAAVRELAKYNSNVQTLTEEAKTEASAAHGAVMAVPFSFV